MQGVLDGERLLVLEEEGVLLGLVVVEAGIRLEDVTF